MWVRKWVGFICTSIALTGCLSHQDKRSEPLEYLDVPYTYDDNLDQSRFDLTFKNETNRAVCLSADQWPGRHGQVNHQRDRIFLVSDEMRYSIKQFNTGYCIGETCTLTIAPGEKITGSIPFEHFDAPIDAHTTSKSFEYDLRGWYCRSK